MDIKVRRLIHIFKKYVKNVILSRESRSSPNSTRGIHFLYFLY